jgi:hypothetical protein
MPKPFFPRFVQNGFLIQKTNKMATLLIKQAGSQHNLSKPLSCPKNMESLREGQNRRVKY